MVFLPLFALFSFLFFPNGNQFTSTLAENKKTHLGGGQVCLYSLVKSQSIISAEKRSTQNEEEIIRNTSTPSINAHAILSSRKSNIKLRKLVIAPTCETDTQNGSSNHMISIPNGGETTIGVENHNGKQNTYSLSKLSRTHKDMGRTSSNQFVGDENPPDMEKKLEGAAGILGNFFEGVSSTPSKGAYRVEIIPRISIQGEYDDNLFLRNSNVVGDYLTTLSPGIKLVANSDTNGIDLDYEFGWVRYHNGTRNNYVRHLGGLKLWQKLGSGLTFRLEDYYIKSDDILAALNQIPVSQRIPDPETLQAYQRNNARALFEYEFAPESSISAGYVYNFSENEDPNSEDTVEYGPVAGFSYWFNQRNGIEVDYEFLRTDYRTEGTAIEARPDLDRQDILGRYLRRFTGRTTGLLQYGLFIRDFPDVSVNYQLHDFSGGFDHVFSSRTSISLGAGYYRATGDTNIKPGYNFLASLDRNFERGRLSLKLLHSFDQGYTEVVPRGFTVFSEGLVSGNYNLVENLKLYGYLSYRRNDYSEDELDFIAGETVPNDQTYRGNCGLTWQFYRWAFLDIGYLHTRRISDDANRDFDDNRFTLKLTGSYPYKW